jgi:hypothetical protein
MGKAMTMAGASLFTVSQVPHGGDGRRVRGVTIFCGSCDFTESLPVNSFTGHSFDNDKTNKFATRKLEARGWKIGKTANSHACPKCLGDARAAASKQVVTAMPEKLTIVKAEPAPAPAPQQEPRTMTRDDRRIIFEKLNEVYVSETVGYAPDWSDERVAKDLGVLVEWVTLIRSENFGDLECGEQFAQKLVSLATELVEISKELNATDEKLDALAARADKIERELSGFKHLIK